MKGLLNIWPAGYYFEFRANELHGALFYSYVRSGLFRIVIYFLDRNIISCLPGFILICCDPRSGCLCVYVRRALSVESDMPSNLHVLEQLAAMFAQAIDRVY